MALPIFTDISSKDKNAVIEKLIEYGSPRQEFFLMIALAIAMATFGLMLDSTIIVIGSMLISPVLYPVISISLGIVMADGKFIGRSAIMILKSVILSVIVATVIGIFLDSAVAVEGLIQDVVNRDLYLAASLVAISAGLAASFSVVKPRLSESLPGVAISVSLIPPLAVIGLGIANVNWNMVSSGVLLFLINVAGIIFAGMVVFSMFNFYEKRKRADKVVAEEDKEIKAEIKEAKEA